MIVVMIALEPHVGRREWAEQAVGFFRERLRLLKT